MEAPLQEKYQVVIIGAGLSGLLTAHFLIKQGVTDIAIIDSGTYSSLGGPAYHKDTIGLLNAPSGGLSINEQNPKEFCEFLGVQGYTFAERSKFGQYMEFKLGYLQSKIHFANATSIQKNELGFQVTTSTSLFLAQNVVLATGNENPTWPESARKYLEVYPHVSNPWDTSQLPKEGSLHIGIIGLGLTMLDYLSYAKNERLKGRDVVVTAISKKKLLLGKHPETPPPTIHFDFEELPTQLNEWVSFIKSETNKVGDYRSVINALRPHTQRVWLALCDSDKLAFIRHLMPYWNNARHRAPMQVFQLFDEGVSEGWFTPIFNAQINAIVEKHQSIKEKMPLWIVNATGPESRIELTQNSLLESTFESKLIAPHPSGIGIIADSSGKIQDGLYALGNLLKGVLFESTAVLEILQQAQIIAADISKNP